MIIVYRNKCHFQCDKFAEEIITTDTKVFGCIVLISTSVLAVAGDNMML